MSRSNNVYIVEDFNYRNIDWESVVTDLESEDLLHSLQDIFLKQVITEPAKEANILELVLANSENMTSGVEVGGS